MRDDLEELQFFRAPNLLGTFAVWVFRDAKTLAAHLPEIFPYGDQREAFIADHLWAQPEKLGADEMAIFVALTESEWTVVEGSIAYSVNKASPQLDIHLVKRPGGLPGDTVAALLAPKDARALDIKPRFSDINDPPPPLPHSQLRH